MATTNRPPSDEQQREPAQPRWRKSGRFLNGTAHTRSNAFCAAWVTPSPAHSEVSSPTTSATVCPVQRVDWIWSPITGNWPSTEFSTDSWASGFPCSTNPRIVTNTAAAGTARRTRSRRPAPPGLPPWSSPNFLMTATGTASPGCFCWERSKARTGAAGPRPESYPQGPDVTSGMPANARPPAQATAAASGGGGSVHARRTVAQDHGRAAPGAERDAPPRGQLGPVAGRRQLVARERRAEHDLHLLQREARAQAPAAPAAERDPGVRARVACRGIAPGGTRRGRDRSRGRDGPGRRWRAAPRRPGTSKPPIVIGRLVSRGSALGSTGRRRRISLIVAVR